VKIAVMLLKASELPESGEISEKDPSLLPSEGASLAYHIDLSLPVSKTEKQ
jgi:hypothetical protein